MYRFMVIDAFSNSQLLDGNIRRCFHQLQEQTLNTGGSLPPQFCRMLGSTTTCGLLQAGCPGYVDYNQSRVPLLRSRVDYCGLGIGRKLALAVKPVSGCSARQRFDAPLGCIAASSVGRGDYEKRYRDEFPKEPFRPSLMKDFVGAVKSFFSFLVIQPRQLRCIEWPTFTSTLKTATLTLVLVALLIVALATVDSALCYLLALFLRRKP